jgi:hypothetical protein
VVAPAHGFRTACPRSLAATTAEQVQQVPEDLVPNLPLLLIGGVEHGVQCDADVHDEHSDERRDNEDKSSGHRAKLRRQAEQRFKHGPFAPCLNTQGAFGPFNSGRRQLPGTSVVGVSAGSSVRQDRRGCRSAGTARAA